MARAWCVTALAAAVLVLAGPAHAADTPLELRSPDGKVVVSVQLDEGKVRYSLRYGTRPVVTDSQLALVLKDAATLGEGCRLIGTKRTGQRGTWKPVYGERSEIPDNYNELVLDFEDNQSPRRRLCLVFRAYDEGAAFCYKIPTQEAFKQATIAREATEFRFTADHPAWAVYSAQGRYAQVRLSQIRSGCERPLTIQVADDLYAAVAEARLVDSARMKLGPLAAAPHALVSQLSGEVNLQTPWTSPWRVVMLGDSPGELLERNYLLLNLNDPCAIEDPSWIKPGKVIREVTLTTAGGKACVDFAVKNNLQYVEFDAGWYGHEYADESDATTVAVDPKRSPGPLDLHEVIRYAEQRGIGILLYVNRRALERQLDELLPLYQRWGVKGVKYGFVRVGSQQWTSWLHEAVRKAAQHRLMVDVHDEYRPTGYSRTYPNLITQEGIAGDETRPTNQQTLTILFTRMLAGAGDNTICYYDARVAENACHAYQLAKAVCLYSPWQFVYWYDRPASLPQGKGGAGGGANRIGDEPELEFFARVPTVWDETRVIHGSIGRYALIARRSGTDWFIGAMNGPQARELDVPLDFLDPAAKYTAHIYSHDQSVPTRTHVRIERDEVTANTTLRVKLIARGGQAVWIECVGK